MLVYVLKTVACMAIFFVFYKLLLEKENMHIFKRFYLLFSVAAALVIPAIVFSEYAVVEPAQYIEPQQYAITDYDYMGIPAPLEEDVLDIEPILWTIYFFGFTFFGIKFIKNLRQIVRRIRKNPKQKSANFIQVLLKENFPPHTFFKYIFLNKQKLESKEIPQEVIIHEETHAKQRHSFDVVCIELLQVVFWFNPLIYLFKKAIKLNHEFLADQAVLKKDIDKTTYQNTLLSYLSPDSQNKYQSKMANAINYSSTRLTVMGRTFEFGSAVGQVKKRFKIMKTHTSKKAVLFRSLLLLPLLALMLYGFSETKVETILNDSKNNELTISQDVFQETLKSDSNQPTEIQFANWKDEEKFAIWIDEKHVPNNTLNNSNPSDFGYFSVSFVYKNARSEKFPQPYQVSLYTKEVYENNIKRNLEVLEIFINSKGKILIKDQIVTLENMNEFFEKSINHEKLLQVYIISEEESPEELPYKIENLIQKYDIPEITFNKSNTKILKVESGATPKEISKYNKLAKSHNLFSDYGIRPRESEIREVKRIHSLMTKEQKRNAEIFPEYPPRKNHNGASKKQLDEYNELAKKYNTMLAESKSIQIKKQDVDRLEYIYNLMSDEQKADAAPFPDFPEPPSPPSPPKAPNGIKGEAFNIPAPQSHLNQDSVTLYGATHNDIIVIERPQPPKPPLNTKYLEAESSIQDIKEEIQRIRYIKGEVDTGEVDDIEIEEYLKTLDAEGIIPPTPPTPPSPLDHVIEMAKNGAIFKYKGKTISSDKAIDLIKNNKDLSISTKRKNNETPIVKISRNL